MRNWDAADWVMHSLLAFCFALVLGVIGLVIFNAGQPTFQLQKSTWACTANHTETGLIPVSTGNTTTLIPTTDTVCDRYERTK